MSGRFAITVAAVAVGVSVGAAVATATTDKSGIKSDVRELHKSAGGHENTTFAPLLARTGYRASLFSLAPVVTPTVGGWRGAQFVTSAHGTQRYQWAAFLWDHTPGGDIAIIGGPAMTMSAAAPIRWPHTQWAKRGAPWPFGATHPATIAGYHGYTFDGTNGATSFTLLGGNPPEYQTHPDQSFRMIALTVHTKTVVIFLAAPKGEPLSQFTPTADRLLSTLRFTRP